MMTPIADMVEQMIAKGASMDVILLAIRTAETSRDATVTRHASSRSSDAVRSARYRAKRKEKQSQPTAGVAMAAAEPTVTVECDASRDGVTNVPLSILPSLEISQGNSKEVRKKEPSTEPRARGARLPDNWEPSAADREYAGGRGLRLVEVEIEATKFRNYWTNRTDRQASKPRWDRAWQNWILNVKQGSKNGQDRSVIAASDRLNAKLAEFSEPDLLGGVRGEAGASNVRLLPARRSG